MPSGASRSVARIVTYDGDLELPIEGQSVSLTLRDEIPVSRGNVICGVQKPPRVADRFEATVVWMAGVTLVPDRPYMLKIGAQTIAATITRLNTGYTIECQH